MLLLGGSGWDLVVLEDFKSFSWASSASGVGSIPTRSRHRRFAWIAVALIALVSVRVAHAQAPPDSTQLPLVRTIGRPGAPATNSSETRTDAPDVGASGELRPAFAPVEGAAQRDDPWRVMVRSALVPGWGQAYNRQWFKAGLVIAGEGALIATAVTYRIKANGETDPTVRADNDNTSRAAIWYGAGVVLLSMIDAYVDAHLYRFADQFRPIQVRLAPAPGASETQVTAALTVGF